MKSPKIVIFGVVTTALFLTGCTTGTSGSSYDKLELIARNPTNHLGEIIAFKGEVMGQLEETNSGATIFQVGDFGGGGRMTTWVVTYPNPIRFLHQKSYVEFLGRVSGSHIGTNAYGGTVRSVAVDAMMVRSTTGSAALQRDQVIVEKWLKGEFNP